MVHRSLGVGMAMVVVLLLVASLPAATTVWDYNASLAASSGYAVMSYRDATTQTNTSFWTTDGLSVPDIEGQHVNYMSFPQSDRAQGYEVARAANSPTLTAYTFLFDVLVPAENFAPSYSYLGLFNTDPVGNSDAELFIDLRADYAGRLFFDRDRDNGKVITANGLIQPSTWHRVAVSYDEASVTEDVRIFVDGVKLGASDGMFGEVGLRLPSHIPIFQDGGQTADAAPALVASTALVERSMTDAEILALGGPKANGFASIYDPGAAPPAPPAGTNAYTAALAATNPLVYFRLNEPAGKLVPDPVQNDGSLTTLAATWGTTGYADTAPQSGAEGANPSWTTAGQALVGLETGNLAAKFRGRFPGTSNSDMLDLGLKPVELDLDAVTWSFWMNSGNTDQASGETNKILITTPRDSVTPTFANKLVVLMTASSEIKIVTDETTAETNNEATTTGLAIADSQWHHVVVVRNGEDAANCKLYVDGVAVSLTTADEAITEGYSYRIGSSGSNSSSYVGWLDEMACWGRELSATEVANLFNAAIGATTVYVPGDATRNGVVDDGDAAALASHWGASGGWSEGDFNADGLVNALDAAILTANWHYGMTEGTAVPEPSALVLLCALSLVLLPRRRRQGR